ncbi:hypothetical protein Htur_2653 [Haloterrigena turkmenica DSM 5511]|uniref:Uncharacterized protein n=1 Tax=Haloterrigena turkmenica (strain ATCC 51198 / DSM 5511 / JCM 9101 / NCIMB 13204 / VKM B-1734 / 4k) TaxID=543526 RepID=D2RWM8_HALTV|nr:hypothetical protein Htur_2653 [Haloterrigena turkmenica DSM 5511]
MKKADGSAFDLTVGEPLASLADAAVFDTHVM